MSSFDDGAEDLTVLPRLPAPVVSDEVLPVLYSSSPHIPVSTSAASSAASVSSSTAGQYSPLVIENISGHFVDDLIHFQLIYLERSLFIWIGNSLPALNNLSLAVGNFAAPSTSSASLSSAFNSESISSSILYSSRGSSASASTASSGSSSASSSDDSAAELSKSLAARLSRKLQRNVFVSFSVDANRLSGVMGGAALGVIRNDANGALDRWVEKTLLQHIRQKDNPHISASNPSSTSSIVTNGK
jgi:hypothetical protein